MAKCSQLTPCFPLRVIRTFSAKDRHLYVLFHVILWFGLVSFFVCLSVYAAQRDYVYFIIPLPCIFLMFGGLFGFRWLAIRNNDKFELYEQQRLRSAAEASLATAEAGLQSTAGNCYLPPPPVYATDYDGPIFTIYGSLVPPPTYEEAQEVAAAAAAAPAASPTEFVETSSTPVSNEAPPISEVSLAG